MVQTKAEQCESNLPDNYDVISPDFINPVYSDSTNGLPFSKNIHFTGNSRLPSPPYHINVLFDQTYNSRKADS